MNFWDPVGVHKSCLVTCSSLLKDLPTRRWLIDYLLLLSRKIVSKKISARDLLRCLGWWLITSQSKSHFFNLRLRPPPHQFGFIDNWEIVCINVCLYIQSAIDQTNTKWELEKSFELGESLGITWRAGINSCLAESSCLSVSLITLLIIMRGRGCVFSDIGVNLIYFFMDCKQVENFSAGKLEYVPAAMFSESSNSPVSDDSPVVNNGQPS